MADPCACSDFRRSRSLAQATARPGAGLPPIEAGMPMPAGTGMSRRSLVLRGAGVALSVYGATHLGWRALEEGVAQAAAVAAPTQPVLVSIFLPGGIDSLSVLAPVGDPNYRALRPTLALAAGSGTTFAEDSRLMWHPAAGGLAQLHAEGKVTAFPAVGYDHPDQSHFTSRHFWEVGATDASLQLGWMGRYLDHLGDLGNPLQGLALDDTLAPALATSSVPVAALAKPEDYNWWTNGVDSPLSAPMLQAYGALGSLPASSVAYRTARTAAREADLVRRQVAPFVTPDGSANYHSPVAYPTGGGDFPNKLAALAAMLAGGLPIRCVAVDGAGGYDTHSDQLTSLPANLGDTVNAVVAFQRDLEARGLADRVLIQLWSEFGRRPRQNVSGTDHGAAGCAFLIGTRASGRMVGEFPGLATLDPDDNLVSTHDFRAMYCALLEQWFATDAGLVIPGAGAFTRPALLK